MTSEEEQDLLHQFQSRVRKHGPCRGLGYALKDGHVARCECLNAALFQFRLNQSNIPAKYRTLGFDKFVNKDGAAYRGVQDYLARSEEHRNHGIGMVLFGPSYTGKSLLLCATLMELLRRGYDCRFEHFEGLLSSREQERQLASQWDFLGIDGISEILNTLTNFRSGVLTGELLHGAAELLGRLLSRRVASGRPVIVTSQVPLSAINAQFPSIANTLIGNAIQLECEDKGFKQRRLEEMM